jgi:ribosome biogenesis ATPase
MQGLWSTHRRNKLNLNSSTSSGRSAATTTVTDDQDVVLRSSSALENLPATPSHAKLDLDANASGKRKIRSSRTVEGSSKRSKMTLSGAYSKDNSPPIARLSDLGGIEPCIEKMLELVAMPLCHPEVYLHTGVQPPRGVLLHGPPGCGKTLLAHAMAGVSGQLLLGSSRIECLSQELGVPFISISAPSIVSGMSGESEKTLRDTFDEAKVRIAFREISILLILVFF